MTSTEEGIRDALPSYDIGGQIGRGGCGVVLSGTHRTLRRPVAIKQIPPQFAEDAAVRRRFVAEARLMAAIDHPHVVPVYDYVEHDDLCLLVMEYLPGGTVEGRFTTQGFDAASAIAVALACAAGLEAAHRRGVLHRDIKPSNLMFATTGTLKLTDFGIAKIVGGDDTLVTRTGEIVGTPSYIAPEQARGQELSAATDIYALATTVYQLLSGVLPFPAGEDSMAVLFMHAFEQPTPLSDAAPAVPSPISEVVMRGLATDPGQRFSSAEEFGVALAEPAALCWGTDWLSAVGIPVIGADTIVAAATGSSGRVTAMPTVSAPLPRTATTRVLPAEPSAPKGIALADVDRRDVAPVRQLVTFRSPRVPFALAAVLALAAVAVAFTGLGVPPHGGDLRPGTVTVAGADPTRSGEVSVDLSKPIPVTVADADADSVALSLDILGTPVARHDAPLAGDAPGRSAALPPPVSRYLLAGRTTAQLTVLHGNTPLGTYRFVMHSVQRATTTAAAAAAIVLALLASAHLESNLRVLRRGRNRVSAVLAEPLFAAALAVAAVAAAWILLGQQPTVATLAASAALAAAAGIAAAIGANRAGRRYHYSRRRRAHTQMLAATLAVQRHGG